MKRTNMKPTKTKAWAAFDRSSGELITWTVRDEKRWTLDDTQDGGLHRNEFFVRRVVVMPVSKPAARVGTGKEPARTLPGVPRG